MGFQGLETFIDSIYKEAKRPKLTTSVFTLKKLSELKLVVDGNDLIHAICKDIYCENEYSGNYNQIYLRTKLILEKLKPYIEIVLFNGSKEDPTRAMHKYEKRITNLTNRANLNAKDYLEVLRGVVPLFMKNLVYEILNELDVNYSMCEGNGDHEIACYANGHNSSGKKFTVLARNSYYFVYNLKSGYLSIKYFLQNLTDLSSLNENTQVPIYHLNDLLEYLNLKEHKTWLYFCILLGDYNLDLDRNIYYLRLKHLNIRKNNLMDIINHLRQTEGSFYQLRSTYSRDKLKNVDQLIAQFEFKNTDYDLIISDETAILNDFDRFLLNIKDLNQCYLPILVEDYTEKTVFSICQQNSMLKHLYSFFTDEIQEYSRTNLPSRDLAQVNRVRSEPHPAKLNDTVLFYLKDLNKLNSSDQVDNMSLLLVSLALWHDWLERNKYTNKLSSPISADLFINAILINLIIIRLKHLNSFKNTRYDDLLKKLDCDSSQNAGNYQEILSIYEKILTEPNDEHYFSNELKLAHRLNEFQAVYYILSIISKLDDFQFECLSPVFVLDAKFVCKYVQEHNVDSSNCFWLAIRLEENKLVHETLELVRDEFKKCLAFVVEPKRSSHDEEVEKLEDVTKEDVKEEEDEDLAHLIETLSI